LSISPAVCDVDFTVVGLAGAAGDVTSTVGMGGTVRLTPPLVQVACPKFGVCTYGGSGVIDGTLTGGNSATIYFLQQTFIGIGGFGCPTSSTWSFAYTTTTPLFLTAS
jgi:hypothetical protein